MNITHIFRSIKRNIIWFVESFKEFDVTWKQQCFNNMTKGQGKVSLMNKHLYREVLNGLDGLANLISMQPIDDITGMALTLTYISDDNGSGHLEFIYHAIVAKAHKLQATWSANVTKDLMVHNIDILDEVCHALAQEIVHELHTEILSQLVALGESLTETVKCDITDTSMLPVVINRVANNIARITHRGTGNFIVVDPVGLSMLQCLTDGSFVRAESDTNSPIGALRFVGTLNTSCKVYMWVYGFGTTENTVLVGYKGVASESDAGFMFCPTHLLKPTVSTDGSAEYETIYGTHVQPVSYYGLVKIENK